MWLSYYLFIFNCYFYLFFSHMNTICLGHIHPSLLAPMFSRLLLLHSLLHFYRSNFLIYTVSYYLGWEFENVPRYLLSVCVKDKHGFVRFNDKTGLMEIFFSFYVTIQWFSAFTANVYSTLVLATEGNHLHLTQQFIILPLLKT